MFAVKLKIFIEQFPQSGPKYLQIYQQLVWRAEYIGSLVTVTDTYISTI